MQSVCEIKTMLIELRVNIVSVKNVFDLISSEKKCKW